VAKLAWEIFNCIWARTACQSSSCVIKFFNLLKNEDEDESLIRRLSSVSENKDETLVSSAAP